jgi:hypothetical protein
MSRKKEISMFEEKELWVEEEVEEGYKAIPTKWVYVIKDDGTKKSRLVVQGNRERFKGETFSPTADRSVLWLVLAVMTLLGLKKRVVDVTGAFITGKINRKIWVKVDGKTYRLKKFLYGLDDAARAFYKKISEHIITFGFIRSAYDQCLFVKWISKEIFTYVIVHVDDFLIMATEEYLIDEFIRILNLEFPCTQKKLDSYLGITVEEDDNGHELFSRPNMLNRIFEKYLLEEEKNNKSPKTPMTIEYSKKITKDGKGDFNRTEYQELLGSLMQLIDVRPDIAFAISKLSQHTTTCDKEDFEQMNRVVKYLWGTRNLKMRLKKGDKRAGRLHVKLRGYADAAFGNLEFGKSQYSYGFDLIPMYNNVADEEDETVMKTIFEPNEEDDMKLKNDDKDMLARGDDDMLAREDDDMLAREDNDMLARGDKDMLAREDIDMLARGDRTSRGNGTGYFFSKSRVGSTTALSSTEIEVTGIVECVKTTIMYREILKEMHLEQITPTAIYNDNQSAITLGKDYNGNHKRVRHFLPKVNWLMDMGKELMVDLKYKNTLVLGPDIGTKALIGPDHERKRDIVMGNKN